MEVDSNITHLQQPLPNVHEIPGRMGLQGLLIHKLSLETTQLFLKNAYSSLK